MALLLPDYLGNRLCHNFKDLNDRSDEEEVGGKVVVITGANSGIGKVLTIQMVKRGAKVVMACRDVNKGREVVNEILNWCPNAELVLVKLDLEDLDSVHDCAQKIKSTFPHINILINNAGFMGTANIIQRTTNGFEQHLAANCIGHFVLTHLLLSHLKKAAPSRIVNFGSRMYIVSDFSLSNINYLKKNSSLGPYNYGPYSDSKLLVMLLSKELGRRLKGTGVSTYSLCPGMVATNLLRNCYSIGYLIGRFATDTMGINVQQGAETPLYCALSTECAHESGKSYQFRKHWTKANDYLTPDLASAAYEIVLSLLKEHMERNKRLWMQCVFET